MGEVYARAVLHGGRTAEDSNCIRMTPVTASGIVIVPMIFTPYLRSANRVSAATVQTKLSSIS